MPRSSSFGVRDVGSLPRARRLCAASGVEGPGARSSPQGCEHVRPFRSAQRKEQPWSRATSRRGPAFGVELRRKERGRVHHGAAEIRAAPCVVRCGTAVRARIPAGCCARRAPQPRTRRKAAARGGGSPRRARRSSTCVGSLGRVLGSSHARGRTCRASPALGGAAYGGLSRHLRLFGHDSNRQQALVSQSQRLASRGVGRPRSHPACVAHGVRSAALAARSRAKARGGISPPGAVAWPLHRGFLGAGSATHH